MAIDMDGNGIRYDRTENLVAWYEVQLQGMTVMWVSVNQGDHALPIIVWDERGAVKNDIPTFYVTPAHAQMKLYATGEGEDVKVDEHVSSTSIHEYVYPRLGYLLALLANPTPSVKTALKKLLNIV